MNILICGVQISDERGKLVLATKLEKQVYCDLYPPPTLFLKQPEMKSLLDPILCPCFRNTLPIGSLVTFAAVDFRRIIIHVIMTLVIIIDLISCHAISVLYLVATQVIYNFLEAHAAQLSSLMHIIHVN